MDYHEICEKIMAYDDDVKNVFIVNSDARLISFSGKEGMSKISEARLAEILDDLLFIVGSRRHQEDVFGRLEYIHIKHRNEECLIFPFEKDKVLCLSLRGHSFNEKEIISKIKYGIASLYQYV